VPRAVRSVKGFRRWVGSAMTKPKKSGKSDGAAKPSPKPDLREKKHDDFLYWIDRFSDCISGVEDYKESYKYREYEEHISVFEDYLDDALKCCDFVLEALMRYRSHEVLTLNEAFEIERPSGYRREAANRVFLLKSKVIRDIRAFEHAGAAKDDALFEAVGKIHGCGKTLAKKFWNQRQPARRGYGAPELEKRSQIPNVNAGGKWRWLPPDLIPHAGQVKWMKERRKKL